MAVVPFDITPVSTRSEVVGGATKTIVFNVKNRLPSVVTGHVSFRTSEHDVDWVKVAGSAERQFAIEGTQQITVEVSPPGGTAPCELSVVLRVERIDSVDLEVAESAAVLVVVVAARPIAPDGKKWRWWIIALAVAVVLAIGGVVWAVIWPKDRSLGETCGSNLRCAEGLSCSPLGAASVCLATSGRACTSNAECVTGLCVNAVCADPAPPDPLPGMIAKTWQKFPAEADCGYGSDFKPLGVLSIYCRLSKALDYASLQARLAMPIYTNRAQDLHNLQLSQNDFGRYNPAFVRWLVQHAIPAAADPAFRAATQPVYDQHLLFAARSFFVAKKLLERSPHYPALRAQYDAQFGSILDGGSPMSLMIPPAAAVDPPFRTFQIAFLFWMRRESDDTADGFHEGLEKLLRTYDARWLTAAQNLDADAIMQQDAAWFGASHP